LCDHHNENRKTGEYQGDLKCCCAKGEGEDNDRRRAYKDACTDCGDNRRKRCPGDDRCDEKIHDGKPGKPGKGGKGH
jgi:hypothetical protein